jgi:hypothetical protein
LSEDVSRSSTRLGCESLVLRLAKQVRLQESLLSSLRTELDSHRAQGVEGGRVEHEALKVQSEEYFAEVVRLRKRVKSLEKQLADAKDSRIGSGMDESAAHMLVKGPIRRRARSSHSTAAVKAAYRVSPPIAERIRPPSANADRTDRMAARARAREKEVTRSQDDMLVKMVRA